MLYPVVFQTEHLHNISTSHVQKPREGACDSGGPLLVLGAQNVYVIPVWLASVLELVQLLTHTYSVFPLEIPQILTG